MNRPLVSLVFVFVGLAGCGAGGPANGVSPDSGSTGDPTPTTDGGYRPGVPGTGLAGTNSGVPNPGYACPAGGEPFKLPGTGIPYCVRAHVDCKSAGAMCPLYVTINTQGWFFDRVADPAKNGKFITVELYTETDGLGVKDKLAETPRVIAKDYPGLDPSRIYAIGWSAGAGAVTRGLCHISKKSDFSTYGTTSDVYAAVVGVGGCGCASDYVQISGNWHVLTWNGMNDPFNGGDSCEAGLRNRAVVNGCASPSAQWQPVQKDDPYAANGDGSLNAERLSFGACARGDVIGYRFKDEAHVVSAKVHFNPKISAPDTVWAFLQGRRK